jgi:CRISPR/Cas system CSM-associated protein Csm2 small subunit
MTPVVLDEALRQIETETEDDLLSFGAFFFFFE